MLSILSPGQIECSPCPKGKKSRTISVRKTDRTQIKLKKYLLPQNKIRGKNLVSLKALGEKSVNSVERLLTQTSIPPFKPGFRFFYS